MNDDTNPSESMGASSSDETRAKQTDSLSELTLQALVDGELSVSELREVVEACERRPELWKCCALAFLEEQAFAQELSRLSPLQVRTPGAAHQDNFVEAMTQMDRSSELVGPLPSSFVSFKAFDWIALAAALFVAFLIGAKTYAPSVDQARDLAPGTAISPNSAVASVDTAQSLAVGNTQLVNSSPDPVTDASPVLNSNEAWQLAVERAGDFVPIDNRLPPELAELQNRGLVRIEATDGFVPVTLGNGGSAIVPVQQYAVKPVRYSY